MLDTDDITKRWIQTGSAFPDPALFQFRKGICYGDHFLVTNLQYREKFRRISGKFSAFSGRLRSYQESFYDGLRHFSGHLRCFRESLRRFIAFFLVILGVFGKVLVFLPVI